MWVTEGYEGEKWNCVTFEKKWVSARLESQIREKQPKWVRVNRAATKANSTASDIIHGEP